LTVVTGLLVDVGLTVDVDFTVVVGEATLEDDEPESGGCGWPPYVARPQSPVPPGRRTAVESVSVS
jgi:hypothetical protein